LWGRPHRFKNSWPAGSVAVAKKEGVLGEVWLEAIGGARTPPPSLHLTTRGEVERGQRYLEGLAPRTGGCWFILMRKKHKTKAKRTLNNTRGDMQRVTEKSRGKDRPRDGTRQKARRGTENEKHTMRRD